MGTQGTARPKLIVVVLTLLLARVCASCELEVCMIVREDAGALQRAWLSTPRLAAAWSGAQLAVYEHPLALLFAFALHTPLAVYHPPGLLLVATGVALVCTLLRSLLLRVADRALSADVATPLRAHECSFAVGLVLHDAVEPLSMVQLLA